MTDSAQHQVEQDHTPNAAERALIERMRDDAARNGDHQGAVDLAALINDQETR